MDRLTKPDFTICTTCRAHDRCEIERRANNTPKCREAQIYERLAAYEDTGLTLEEIQQIRQPASDMQKVKHGEWISNDLGGYKWAFHCSLCGFVDGFPFNDRFEFCPHCGAKMDASKEA